MALGIFYGLVRGGACEGCEGFGAQGGFLRVYVQLGGSGMTWMGWDGVLGWLRFDAAVGFEDMGGFGFCGRRGFCGGDRMSSV